MLRLWKLVLQILVQTGSGQEGVVVEISENRVVKGDSSENVVDMSRSITSEHGGGGV